MTADLARRLSNLRASYDDGDIDLAAYEAGLVKLRGQYGDDAVTALLRELGDDDQAARSHTLVVTGSAQVPVAVSGDVHGSIFINGRRGRTNTQLLAGYLGRLQKQCELMPLQGVRERKAATDVLRIGLDQVYTQLATIEVIEREVFTGAALATFDAQAFLERHTGDQLLPHELRTQIRVDSESDERFARRDAAGRKPLVTGWQPPEGFIDTGMHIQDLTTVSADQLADAARSARYLSFSGPELVTDAIAANRRLVLLGEPGGGKSTALRYLALTLAAAGLAEESDLRERLVGWDALGTQGKLLPIFVPLLPLAKRLAEMPGHRGGAADLWNYLADHLERERTDTGLATAVIEELETAEKERAERVLLLLDGLDEVAGAESRTRVTEAVLDFAQQYPHCRIVVACRVRAYEGAQNVEWRLPGWPTATLAEWTPPQMQHFVRAWYAAAATAGGMPESRRDERTEALIRALAVREDLQRLGGRPLLLTIMALVHLNDGKLPEDRVSLYSRCLDILLAQWEIAGKDETVYGTLMEYIGLPDADVKALRPLLTRAAFLAQEASEPGSPGRLGRSNLRDLVAEALADRKHPNAFDGANRFLEYTDVRAGLLQASDAGDAYGFPHQTFQEYLAGLELVSGADFVERIMDRRTDDRWRVPIQLGMGHAVSEGLLAIPYQLLSELLTARGRPEDRRQRDLTFAAELASDVGWDRLERGGSTFLDLRERLATALAGVVEGTVLPAAERVHAGVLLGAIGDLRPGVCALPPAMVTVMGGSFVIGLSDDELKQLPENEQPYFSRSKNVQPVQLAGFELARYPLTNAQYQLFMEEQGYDPEQSWWDDAARAWLARDDAATEGLPSWRRRQYKDRPEFWEREDLGRARPNHPVVGVSWHEAVAFCRWLTQHRGYNPQGYQYLLPSEAEWEFAARGPSRRPYPWGDEAPDAERANFGDAYNNTTAVGCFTIGRTPETGIAELAGNVWEWTCSEYRPYPYDPTDGREDGVDAAEKEFTLRGGGWGTQPFFLRASNRGHFTPDNCNLDVGFRLARRPPPVKH